MGRHMGQDPIEYLNKNWLSRPAQDEYRENDEVFD